MALRVRGCWGPSLRRPRRSAGSRCCTVSVAVNWTPFSVLARSHELVPYARLGAVRAGHRRAWLLVRRGRWSYWSHAACRSPLDHWPYYAFRRRHFLERRHALHRAARGLGVSAEVPGPAGHGRPAHRGRPGGARKSDAGWWWALERGEDAVSFLLDTGECVHKRVAGGGRVRPGPRTGAPRKCRRRRWTTTPASGNWWPGPGLASGWTVADLADTAHLLATRSARRGLPDTGLVPVRVAGWKDDALGPDRQRWRPGNAGPGTGPRCCPVRLVDLDRATHPAGVRFQPTDWRRTSPPPSASTATSRCRCCPGVGCAVGSTPKRVGTTLIAQPCRWTRPTRWPRWRRRFARGGVLGRVHRGRLGHGWPRPGWRGAG